MASGDGWLMRLRTSARSLSSRELRAVARLAHAYGNGVIELTRRANLQLRGLRIESIPELRAELIALGLVDASPLREARPALLVDPVAGIAGENADLAGLLDDALAQSTSELSAKLGVVLDAGSGSVTGIDADIRVEAREPAGRVRIYLGAHAGEELLGEHERADAPGVVRSLLARLASFAATTSAASDAAVSGEPEPETCGDAATGERRGAPRMRDLLAVCGIESLRASGASVSAPTGTAAPAVQPRAALGFHEATSRSWFGLGLPFGSASHAEWLAIAELSERFGASEVRLTAAREVLIVGVRAEVADRLERAAHAFGFITEDSDARRRIVACSGAPACSSAYGETRSLASALGKLLQPLLAAGTTLHVSGCEKGCAARGVADLNIVLAPGGARLARNADLAAASGARVESVAALCAKLATLYPLAPADIAGYRHDA
jgi:precorrin-3B synthase